MLQCKICNKEFGSYTGLASHINLIHKITSKDYYIKYLKHKMKVFVLFVEKKQIGFHYEKVIENIVHVHVLQRILKYIS